MKDDRERMDRRGFLANLAKAAAAVTAGAAVLGGCKCGEEDVQWSDEDDSSGGGEGGGEEGTSGSTAPKPDKSQS